jgi:predicted enzyme related to lactoylglutathione lyase
MLKESRAFSSFSVDDLQKAKKFYVELLGIETADNPMGVLELKVIGTDQVMLYPKPNHEPATFTVLNFLVPDIDETVDALIKKGIIFEQYGCPIATDEKGIVRGGGDKGPNIAWFKDPAGNILSVI